MRWAVPAIAALAFAGIYFGNANSDVFMALNAAGPATSDWLWANITVLGDTLVGFALCLAFWRRRPQLVWAFVFMALLGTAWVHGLKPFVDVARPPAVLGGDVHVIGPAYKAHAFPSGHATTAFAVAGLIALGIGSRMLSTGVIFIAVLAALSRAVVGVHWPLDILAGAFGGWLSAMAAVEIARRTSRFGERPWVQWAIAFFLAGCAAWLAFGPNKSGYPQAELLMRAIGIACLASAIVALRPRKPRQTPVLD